MFLTVTLIFILIVVISTHFRGKYNQYYWEKRGAVFYEKNKTGGPLWQFITGNKALFQIFHEIYKSHENSPAVGIGSFFDQALYVKDPINIQHIVQGDFQSFNHRGFAYSEQDVLSNNVLMLHGPKWKLVRRKMTPLFTSVKLKSMFYIIDKSAQDFVEYLKLNPEKLKGDTLETLNNFCTATIAASVFGIETRSIFDSPFREIVKQALAPNFWTNLKFAISGFSEKIFKALRLSLFTSGEEFFIRAMKQVIRKREKENVRRHDFVDMCVDLQKNGTMVDNDTGLKLEPTDELLAAQAFFFFVAGVEPSAAGMFATLFELGRNSDVLQRVHDDIDALFEKYNGQITYEAVTEFKYLENVLNESLRLYPPIGLLTRKCVNDSVLPVGNVVVENGVKIFTPIYEVHHDPKFFPDPETFDPDRFAREGEINDMTYMPFGKGNRVCIGARFARVLIMTGIVHLLKYYTLHTSVFEGGIRYNKEQVQVRLRNVSVEFVPRQ